MITRLAAVLSQETGELAAPVVENTFGMREVEKFEFEMLKLPQEPCPVVHRFGPGIYIREVTLKAGIFALGHRQKTEHLNIILKGCVEMLDGSVLTAPLLFVGKPGRKCGYVREETVWLNVYSTHETDVEKLEDTLIEKSETFTTSQSAGMLNGEGARKDFVQMLLDLGVTADTVREQSENEDDQIPMPHGSYKFQLAPSPIEGRGVFACSGITAGETIGPARIGSERTPLGRYTNHGKAPNAAMVRRRNQIDLVAVRNIEGNCGGQLGEEITIDYREAVGVSRCLQ